jgi:GntR family transcriptional repressor for pyruvate dehydrogenase complex
MYLFTISNVAGLTNVIMYCGLYGVENRMAAKKSSVPLEPIEKNSMTELVAKQLLGLLTDGYLKPGDKLPPERELANQLKVGRTTVREALKLLTLSGLLEARRGDGTYVRKDFTNFVLQQITWPLHLSTQQVDMILEVRLPLEIQAAKLAAERSTPEELREIAQLIELPKSKSRNVTRETEIDLAFHEAIADASHNELLCHLMHSLQSILRQYIELAGKMTDDSETTVEEHRRIYEAIAAKDPKVAGKAMEEHISISKIMILKAFNPKP